MRWRGDSSPPSPEPPCSSRWSTPGAALLLASIGGYRFSDAVGAFLLASLAATVLGVTGWFGKIIAVVLAITAGVVVAGIVGALVAVPVAAVLNGVFKHLHGASVAEAAVGPSGELPPLDPAVREAAAELDAESHRAAVTERIELDGPNGSNGPNDPA